jgi:hypothetical protein
VSCLESTISSSLLDGHAPGGAGQYVDDLLCKVFQASRGNIERGMVRRLLAGTTVLGFSREFDRWWVKSC